MKTTTEQLDAILNPPGRRALNTVIGSFVEIEPKLTERDTIELQSGDLLTLLAAARYGRNRAEEELARLWGTFG